MMIPTLELDGAVIEDLRLVDSPDANGLGDEE
jgi:hypothetical protein